MKNLLIIFLLIICISCNDKRNNSKPIQTSNKTSSLKKTNTVEIEKETLNENKLSLKTEKSKAIVKRIERINNRNLITVDFVIFECGKDDDGLDHCDVINNNPKLRTYILSDELFNVNKEALKDCDICYWDIEASNGEIISISYFVLS